MRRVLLTIVLAFGFVSPVWADVQAGIDAYKRGDYATALKEWQPLPEAGSTNAQYDLSHPNEKARGVLKDYAEVTTWYRKAAGKRNKIGRKMFVKLEGDPENAHAFFEQGLKYGRQGRHEEALKAFRMAASLQPNNATYHRNIGVALASMRRWREAVVAYKRAIQLQPELAAAHHNLGAALGNMGHIEEAKKAFEETIRLNPNDIEARKKLAWTQKAISSKGPLKGRYRLDKTRFYPKKHNTEEKKFLFAALKEGEGFQPRDYPGLSAEQNLASSYDVISSIVREFQVGYAGLGVVLGRVGLWEEASQAFLKAAKKKPNSAGTWGNLGVAYHVLGNYKQSENAFQKALKLEPGYFDARPLQKKIAENSRKNGSVLQ